VFGGLFGLTACASSPPGKPPVSPSTSPAHDPAGRIAASSVTAASNKAAAEEETNRLLTMLSKPAGAVAFAGAAPARLEGPATGVPGSQQLIDATAFWRVPLAASDVRAWVTSHLPSGFTIDITGGGAGVQGVSFAAPPDPAAPANGEPSLAVSWIADPATPADSIWRIDGMQIWYDPTPVKDNLAGARIRVTVAGGCPASLGDNSDVSNDVDGLDVAMVPPGEPTGGLICQYPGANPTIDQPKGSRTLTAAQAVALATQVRKLAVGSEGIGPHSCPMDDGQVTIAVLTFPQGDVDLWWRVSGCQSVRNGHIVSLTGTLTLP